MLYESANGEGDKFRTVHYTPAQMYNYNEWSDGPMVGKNEKHISA